jgi:hypothetical protein
MIQGTEGHFEHQRVGVLSAGYDDHGVGFAELAVLTDYGRDRLSLKRGEEGRLSDGSVLTLNDVLRLPNTGTRATVEVTIQTA